MVDAEDFTEAMFSVLSLTHVKFSYEDVNDVREFLHLKPVKPTLTDGRCCKEEQGESNDNNSRCY